MNDGEETDRQNRERQYNAGEPLPPAVARLASNPEQPHGNAIQRQANAEPEPADPWFRNPDWHMVWITILLFAVGAYTAWVFHRQFKEMQTQTGILNTQAQQAAADSIESGKKVERQLAIAKQQADAAQQTAKNFRVEQRAWIGVKSVDLKGIVFSNFGRLPALNISNSVTIHFEDKHTNITDAWVSQFHISTPEVILHYGPLFPGEPLEAPWPPRYDITKYRRWSEVQHGTRFLYIFGEVRYSTIGEWHTTKFCGEWVPSLSQFDPGNDCKGYNDAN